MKHEIATINSINDDCDGRGRGNTAARAFVTSVGEAWVLLLTLNTSILLSVRVS